MLSRGVRLSPKSRSLFDSSLSPLVRPIWRPTRFAVWLFAFAIAFALSANFAHGLAIEPGHFVVFWPPSGFFLAALLLTPTRRWIAIGLIGAALTVALTLRFREGDLTASLIIALAIVGEVLAAAGVVRFLFGSSFSLNQARHVLVFGVATTMAALAAGALVAKVSRPLSGESAFFFTWITKAVGDVLGIWMVTPLIWGVAQSGGVVQWFSKLRWARALELLFCCALLAMATQAVYASPVQRPVPSVILFPFLMWAALRFGYGGMSLGVCVLIPIAAMNTRFGQGPLAYADTWAKKAVILNVVLAFYAFIGHALAVIMSERRWAMSRLREANEDLEQRVKERTERLAQVNERLVGSEEQLRVADRRKDEFLAALAHELRNPLAPISNALHILRLSKSEEQTSRAIDVMTRQLAHTVRLVDDLLDVSRISRGQVTLKKQRIALRTIVDSAVEASRPLIDQRSHRLTVSIPEETLELDGDPTRLTQVLSNLFDNAAKYTPIGGEVALIALREGDQVVIVVRDNGKGIPNEALPRIFDLFMQVTPVGDDAHGGLGIGLALVQRLVELHGGVVHALSAGLGKGSEFVLRLPFAQTPNIDANVAVSSPSTKLHVEKCRVLIADDNEDSADTLEMVLELMDYQVRKTYDGFTAVRIAEEFRPRIAFLDVGMPKLDGCEAARRIREHEWGKEMMLIALTGWGQKEDRQRTHEAGFDVHLVKPLDKSVLTSLLSQVKTDALGSAH